ncbi:ATP-grasp ribosomal peptide maturase [Kitasatospora sp. SolWspMP-SS2h]|uniref:ATP-grasp ribosomal peptide maturase n=1 Tax=Kitasatospora sp. SolWspMP-SS2h TaxID=1305729 RepID=UPI000DBA0F8B|nr:ATP-grasp ribosomal peptide maturase [Kitasatospora sp. SolWspMP-SS2h]RAJ34634.1 ATP-grasp ribosomal peptide maturase [Kitasatospora sp. SolWspMP-SS2h]
MTGAGPVAVATAADDMTADTVITELNRRGTEVIRFNPADLGTDLLVSARFGSRPTGPAGQLRTPSRSADLTGIRSLYWRRPDWPAFDHLDPADARFAAAQTRFGLGGTLYSLPNCLFVNHPLRNRAAEHKPLQLAAAQRLGLTVPPTLVTNDHHDAREFITAHDQVVFKTLRWTPYQKDGVGMTTWTEPVTAGEIDERITVVPHLFQARVDKTADIRVIVAGTRVFAVRIDSDLLDWRLDYSTLAYRPLTLPSALEKALLAFLEDFHLVSGSFDLALDHDGNHHFLELNPNGQWGWLEDETGLPLTSAFADLLTRGAP